MALQKAERKIRINVSAPVCACPNQLFRRRVRRRAAPCSLPLAEGPCQTQARMLAAVAALELGASFRTARCVISVWFPCARLLSASVFALRVARGSFRFSPHAHSLFLSPLAFLTLALLLPALFNLYGCLLECV